jgi:hypothetical protein
MSQPKIPPKATPVRLSDDDMKSTALDRRSFLSKLGVRSTVVLGAVLSTTSCGGSDECDSDRTTDANPTDPPNRKLDTCDAD